MSDQEPFLSRWSRRKRAAGEADGAGDAGGSAPDPAGKPDADRVAPAPGTEARAATPGDTPGGTLPPFDPASLPPLESICATTDIRAFLAPGVPPELTRAALRRVWTADPAIRDFVGLAENSWDFNAAGSITGFGTLEMTDELRRRITEMVGRSLMPEAPDREPSPASPSHDTVSAAEPAPVPDEPTSEVTKSPALTSVAMQEDLPNNNSSSSNSPSSTRDEQVFLAVQNHPEKPDDVRSTGSRRHGRALPE
jgi:Protein of unknown function (DUF3306)